MIFNRNVLAGFMSRLLEVDQKFLLLHVMHIESFVVISVTLFSIVNRLSTLFSATTFCWKI